jgi:hypothetical protein
MAAYRYTKVPLLQGKLVIATSTGFSTGGTCEVQFMAWSRDLRVTAGGTGVVSHVGAALVRMLARPGGVDRGAVGWAGPQGLVAGARSGPGASPARGVRVSDDPGVERVQRYSIWLVNWFMSK